MNKHTPGPWFLTKSYFQEEDATPLIVSHENELIGTVAMDEPEWFSNARLILAAPELLEALRDLAYATLEDDAKYPDPLSYESVKNATNKAMELIATLDRED